MQLLIEIMKDNKVVVHCIKKICCQLGDLSKTFYLLILML